MPTRESKKGGHESPGVSDDQRRFEEDPQPGLGVVHRKANPPGFFCDLDIDYSPAISFWQDELLGSEKKRGYVVWRK
jgi:hypothetical protein